MCSNSFDRRAMLGSLAGAGLVVSLATSLNPARAQQNVSQNVTYGLALRGFDPVAYFTKNKAVKGLPTFTVDYEGATYEFESEQNKALFAANPARYVPQYGGFCAYAASRGYKADIDPYAFAINNGKLYVNFAEQFRDEFQADVRANIEKADANWTAKVRDMKDVVR